MKTINQLNIKGDMCIRHRTEADCSQSDVNAVLAIDTAKGQSKDIISLQICPNC